MSIQEIYECQETGYEYAFRQIVLYTTDHFTKEIIMTVSKCPVTHLTMNNGAPVAGAGFVAK